MKNRKLTLAILAMVVATVVSVAIVSCKKEDNATLLGSPEDVAFTPPQVDDMCAYLKDFKKKIQSSTRGDEETLSLDEAAWHLSSLANYEFANANVDFSDVRIDSIIGQINVVDGRVSLSELNIAYAKMSRDIDAFYQSLDLANKHFRFIDVAISSDGNMVIRMVTTYTLLDHVWYYNDIFEADSVCDMFLSEDSIYTWNTTAVSELNRILNIIEHHPLSDVPSARVFYTQTRTVQFFFRDWIDQYGSPFALSSRLFAWGAPDHVLSWDQMCYCIDSYAGLGYQYIIDHPYVTNEHPAIWLVEANNGHFNDHWWSYYHDLTVTYAQGIVVAEGVINH